MMCNEASQNEFLPSWFQYFNKELVRTVSFSEHEAFDHPVTCKLPFFNPTLFESLSPCTPRFSLLFSFLGNEVPSYFSKFLFLAYNAPTSVVIII